jgi:hypothetical protein
MPEVTRGNPSIKVDRTSGVVITIDSEWSSTFQQFLTARRMPSFLEAAGTRVGDRLCDLLSLGRTVDVAQAQALVAEWRTVQSNNTTN